MIGFLTFGLLDLCFKVPGEAAHKTGGRNDGGLSCGFSGIVFSGESVRLDVTAPGAVGDGKIEPVKKQAPAGLTGVKPLS